jgi:hypothetical protein
MSYTPPPGYGYPPPAYGYPPPYGYPPTYGYVAPTNQQSSTSSYATKPKPKPFPSLDPFVDNKTKWIALCFYILITLVSIFLLILSVVLLIYSFAMMDVYGNFYVCYIFMVISFSVFCLCFKEYYSMFKVKDPSSHFAPFWPLILIMPLTVIVAFYEIVGYNPYKSDDISYSSCSTSCTDTSWNDERSMPELLRKLGLSFLIIGWVDWGAMLTFNLINYFAPNLFENFCKKKIGNEEEDNNADNDADADAPED